MRRYRAAFLFYRKTIRENGSLNLNLTDTPKNRVYYIKLKAIHNPIQTRYSYQRYAEQAFFISSLLIFLLFYKSCFSVSTVFIILIKYNYFFSY